MIRRSRKWCAPATAASLRRQARRAVARRQPRPVAAPKPLRTIRRGGWGIPRLSWQRLPMAALPPKGLRLKLRTLTLTTYHSLGVELLAASGLGQRRLTPRNPDLRVTSIDERGAPTPTVRPTTASRLKSSIPDLRSCVLDREFRHADLPVATIARALPTPRLCGLGPLGVSKVEGWTGPAAKNRRIVLVRFRRPSLGSQS